MRLQYLTMAAVLGTATYAQKIVPVVPAAALTEHALAPVTQCLDQATQMVSNLSSDSTEEDVKVGHSAYRTWSALSALVLTDDGNFSGLLSRSRHATEALQARPRVL